MLGLEDVIPSSAPLRWIIGKITGVYGEYVTVLSQGVSIDHCGYADNYLPVVGDVVHCLSWGPNGVLVLCSNNGPLTPPTPYVPGAPVTVTPLSYATHGPGTTEWATSSIVQVAGSKTPVWFYSAGAMSAVSPYQMMAVEISITRTSGGPPEFVPVVNTSGTGVLTLGPARRFSAPPALPAGVATWVPLPLSWAYDLFSGVIKGIGIQSEIYSGVYSASTGNLRFSPL